MGLITGSTDKNDFADCDIVIEAVFEDMELKKSIFTELDQICKPGRSWRRTPRPSTSTRSPP